MSKSDFHTIRKLKLQVRVLVFSVLNVSELNYTQVDMRKKLEETRRVHVHVRLLSQNSAFDLLQFLSKNFSKICVAKLGVWLICECGLYAGVYGIQNNSLKTAGGHQSCL